MKYRLLLLLTIISIAPEAFALHPGVKQYKEPIEAIDFKLVDLNNNTHRLTDYRGRVVVINFWATWCVPCRKEIPSLKLAWYKLKKKNIQLLGIATKDSKEEVMHFQNENHIEFPLPIDENGKVADDWAVIAVPTAFVIDQKGYITMRIVGGSEWNNPKLIDSIIALKNKSGTR